ncbi:MAG TPA: nitrite reductase small subunit NirD [Burkholderiales bacterium]|nr:nitrite reductase small subunit NirD [Burkholderiales bacterium]
MKRHEPAAVRACRLEDIVPNTGVCALVGGEQVAIFRLDDDRVYALGNNDPFSRANVLSRGIVGDLGGELVVASPVYKQHFSLVSGRCIEDALVQVPVYAARVEEGFVLIEPRREVATTCCYCGIGCGVLVRTENRQIVAVRGDPSHPANYGRLCSKGLSLHKADPSFRALYPEIGNQRQTWDAALGFIVEKFRSTLAAQGADAVGFYISGQFLTEDYYVFNKLARGLIGTNNIDTNSRLCMASAVAGYKQTLGADAPPACYEDVESAECVFIAGSNTAWAHPVLYRRIEKANPKHLIVVDPRKTETAHAATLHLQIVPGTDVALFNGMLHVMLREEWVDRAYIARCTEGLDSILGIASDFSLKRSAAICGIEERRIVEAARLFATSSATLSLYCQGLNQSSSGTAKNVALINLHLATGHIGRPGAGPFSLTGQPNAMGGREVGGMANLLSAHRDLGNASHRAEIAAYWGVRDLPAKPGKTAVEMFEAVRAGEIKIVWIACTNPAQSLPDQKLVHEALERAELVIVQDAYRNTETARYAHVFLPAAGWGEKEGTMTNSERRISRVRAAVPPPGEAWPDWRIAVEFSRRLAPVGERLFPFEAPESIFNEHRETTSGRDLDITGLSYALLDARGPQQWPFPEQAGEGRKRLYEEGVFPTPSGRARFVATPYRPVAEEVDEQYPLRLTTGRLRDQWHTMSRTGTVAGLFAHEPEPRLMMHPEDLSRFACEDLELVKVSSRRGDLYASVAADPGVRPGLVYLPMHWGARFLGGDGRLGVNELTLGALDPSSKQPELKHCAVRVLPARLPWRLVAFGGANDVATLFEQLTPFMSAVPFAARTLVGRERAGVRLVLGAQTAPSQRLLACIDDAFGLGAADVVKYEDASVSRRVALQDDRVRAVRVSGNVRSERWLRDLWLRDAPVRELRRHLQLAADAPLDAGMSRGRTLCNCFDVGESEIDAFLATRRSLDELQRQLKCGTNCGSCLPELRKKVDACAA